MTRASTVADTIPGYGDTAKLTGLLEEVSRLLNAYIKAILTPGS